MSPCWTVCAAPPTTSANVRPGAADLIVEAPDGGVVAIEVKLSATVTDADCKDLNWLRDRLGPALRVAVVVSTGAHAYRRADGIVVVSPCALGP